MRPLIWKELRENAGWAAILLAGVSVAFAVWAVGELPVGRIDESLASDEVLGILLLATTLGAFALGLLQIVPELGRDAWAFLIHRPVSATRIFLAKTIAGTGLYLAATLVPFSALALVVAAGAPERRVFHPYMLWPGAAIVLAGAGLHPAAMLVALRRARWLGTRLLPLVLPAATVAVTISWILNVNELPSGLLLLFILGSHAVTSLAAWGSFIRGGESSGQPAPARVALGLTLGLAALGVLGTLLAGAIGAMGELRPRRSLLDRAAAEAAKLREPMAPIVHHFPGMRGRERIAIGLLGPLGAADQWIHSTPGGVLFGYRVERSPSGRRSVRLVRTLGPDGFAEPPAVPERSFGRIVQRRWRDQDGFDALQPRSPFPGQTESRRRDLKERRHRAVLACEEGIYDMDFAREEVRLVLAPPPGEILRGASMEPAAGVREIAMVTDRSVTFHAARAEVVGEVTDVGTGERADITTFLPGSEIARAALPDRVRAWPAFAAGRGAGPDRYVFQRRSELRGFFLGRIIEADASGTVIAERYALPEGEDAELARASLSAAAVFTPPAIAASAALADELLLGGPGLIRASASARPGWVIGLGAILVLQALACAAAARMTSRRRGFSRSERRLWIVLGALFGPAGLVALAGTRDWSPAEPCAACGRPRSVSLDRCPRCGAGLEPPPRDGTEVIEETGVKEGIGIEIRSIP